MKTIFITILTTFWLLIPNNMLYSTYSVEDEKHKEARLAIEQWKYDYEATIWFIKQHEGFNGGRPYSCPAGHFTIGYGHVVKANELFPARITEQEADRLLRKDFNTALKLAEKYTNLQGSQKLAIAHFIFAKGIGNFLRSSLKKKIENNEPIDDELLKWCYYTKPDGTKVKSKYSYNIRLWELQMYNKGKNNK